MTIKWINVHQGLATEPGTPRPLHNKWRLLCSSDHYHGKLSGGCLFKRETLCLGCPGLSCSKGGFGACAVIGDTERSPSSSAGIFWSGQYLALVPGCQPSCVYQLYKGLHLGIGGKETRSMNPGSGEFCRLPHLATVTLWHRELGPASGRGFSDKHREADARNRLQHWLWPWQPWEKPTRSFLDFILFHSCAWNLWGRILAASWWGWGNRKQSGWLPME